MNSKFRKISTIKSLPYIIKIVLIIKISPFLYLNINKEIKNKIRIDDIIERSEQITNKHISSHTIDKDLDEEYKDIQEYIYMIMNGTLYNQNEVFKKSENPKISIVISIYNGEGYLEKALLSIQNQDFKDIEIIMVDDCSKDNSINLIKKLMVKDPRIRFYQNEENKGALYTKTKGVLLSKGKYVMTLDEDDIYIQRDAFSTLYYEAEENNLDILGFSILSTSINLQKKKKLYRYLKTNVIYQPNIPTRRELISNYFFRTELFVNCIKQIDNKYMNVKMIVHDDFLILFLLTRNAHNLKHIKRIFYAIIRGQNKDDIKIKFRLQEKLKNRENLKCLSYINYIEFILIKTKKDIIDKKLASSELKKWFLTHNCRYNKFIRKAAINVLELFLRNKFIEKEIKNEILTFLNEEKLSTTINQNKFKKF